MRDGHIPDGASPSKQERAMRKRRALVTTWLIVAGILPVATMSGAPAQRPASQQPPAKPDCIVSDASSAAGAAPTTMPLDTRKAAFIDLQQAVARAQREAAAAYPTVESGALVSPGNVQ